MNSLKKQLESKIKDLYSDLQSARCMIDHLSRLVRSKQNDSMERFLENAQSKERLRQTVADTYLKDSIDQVCAKVKRELNLASLEIQPWSSIDWSDLTLPTVSPPPEYIRIGYLYTTGLVSQLPTMPAILPLVNFNHLLVFSRLSLLQKGASLLTSVAWRIVAFSSPTKYRFVLIDSMDRGMNFASLLNLPSSIRGERIYCQQHEIEHVLRNLVSRVEEITQTRLGDRYSTISDYNVANPRTAVPYYFVVFTAYPHGFTDQASEALLSIARTGQRAGVYLIGGLLSDARLRHGVAFDQFLDYSACISVNESGLAEWGDPLFAHVPFIPDPAPSKNLVELLALEVNELLKSEKDIIEFGEFMLDVDDWWTGNSINGLQANIGVDQSGKQTSLDIGNEDLGTHHALVGGATGSGKTNFLHELILSLCTTYSPDELELYLIDFKEGVEFQDYATYQLPHVRAVVIEAEREFGLSILEYLNQEMTYRSELFKDAGAEVVNIRDYRCRTGRVLPRIVVIIDEFIDLFNHDDAILTRAYQAMDNITRQGRAYGIHVVLAAQRPIATFQNLQSIKSQIRLRIAFRCNEPDNSVSILGDLNERAAQLEKTGYACITSNPNSVAQTDEVRIGYVSQDDRVLYLKALRSLYVRSSNRFHVSNMVVFSRDEPAIWRDNPILAKHLGKGTETDGAAFWLGQPLKLAQTVEVHLENKEREHLIILGSDRILATNILINSMLGLFVTCSPRRSEFFVVTPALDDSSADTYWRLFEESVPHAFECISHSDIGGIVEELDLRISERIQRSTTDLNIFLFIQGLHRIPDVRASDEYSVSAIGERLGRILKYGAQVGVHAIVWADRSEILREATGMTNGFDSFSHRVALHMDVDESNNLLGASIAAKLGSSLKRLFYRCEWWERDAFEKIKPYEVPSIDDTLEIMKLINDKWRVEE